MTHREEKNDNLLGIILLVIILMLIVCGGYFICNNFQTPTMGTTQFGSVDAADILSMGRNFTY
jgi:hypothetical protein